MYNKALTNGIKMFSGIVAISSVIQLVYLFSGKIPVNELESSYFIALVTLIMLVVSIWFLVSTIEKLDG